MKLNKSEIDSKLQNLSSWIYDKESEELVFDLTLENFKQCVELLNKVLEVAEKLNHHPDVRIYNYKKIEIRITTHDQNGITEIDFEFASLVNKLLN
ncbi:MAG: 4a-hydroxytetrahydrobiopterin dehydratase [Candidatus Dojkabacteria bacterium]|nr:4a-hydroxytetrahydrobiopterin dehydratase [Candidatus Dojkabacteria bacterium]MDQ7020368.1 4a-hydroxytetrahydrobiopterin dehydratase [Candidatus Dojkabacteria bacterium]